MAKFEIVSKYAGAGLALPKRATKYSAGYDFAAASGGLVSSLFKGIEMAKADGYFSGGIPIADVNDLLKKFPGLKPALIPTGIKCKLAEDEYLEIVARSSLPLKCGLIVANGQGIIDSDYYNSAQTEGEIFIQVLNFTPQDIYIEKGTKLAQGIIHKYIITEDDMATGERVGGMGSTSEVRT